MLADKKGNYIVNHDISKEVACSWMIGPDAGDPADSYLFTVVNHGSMTINRIGYETLRELRDMLNRRLADVEKELNGSSS